MVFWNLIILKVISKLITVFQFLLCDICNGRDDLTKVLGKLIRWTIIEGTYGSNGVIFFMSLDSGIKFGDDFFVTPELLIFFRWNFFLLFELCQKAVYLVFFASLWGFHQFVGKYYYHLDDLQFSSWINQFNFHHESPSSWINQGVKQSSIIYMIP